MTLTAILSRRQAHRRTFALAWPMILSNITIPLLGLVDTAVIGHLDEAYYLGGVAVGSMIITFLMWMLGFLRMGTTALVAQGLGADDIPAQFAVLKQGVALALVLALWLLLLQWPIRHWGLPLAGGSEEVQRFAAEYFAIRIWGAPAALVNLVLLGFLLGRGQPRVAMWQLLLGNGLNIALDLLLVVGLGWGVAGAAWASLAAEYGTLALAAVLVWRQLRGNPALDWYPALQGVGRLVRLNRDIFLRTLCLQLCFSFVTLMGARLGDTVVAGNAVLMNFLLVISYALDGFAYSAEVEVGRAWGARDRAQLRQAVVLGWFWSAVTALVFVVLFALAGEGMILLLTDIDAVRAHAIRYLPWVVALPALAFSCFLFDGVYIGAALGRPMRNAMLVSALGFFALWWGFHGLGNHGLWLALCGFMLLRGLTLGWHYLVRLNPQAHWAG
ncbi:MATE family efflux transporter [Ferrimonas sediminicola]|uniref:MATE family efflux transporter n=1 Tax=Ferrimonas sediminicola TaxID=2569538 RepID=A0A4U1BAR3_9GAMM|nr:MATE family efflux transporter [Ferrimonas sediminicola]TKB47625.1 MATE family efflux transporter [Ferrimonas sediminicola]